MRSFQLLVFILASFLVLNIKASGVQPPPPNEIYQEINMLWECQEFDLIHDYIDDVLHQHPQYIPAMVAKIGILKIDGAQYTEASIIAEKVEKLIVADPLASSSGFYDLFMSYSRRLREIAEVYSKRGLSEDNLRSNVKIEKHWYPNSSWSQELLFLSVPYARGDEGKIRKYELQLQDNANYSEYKDHLLRERLFNLSISSAERKSLAAELAQRAAGGGIKGIINALSHPTAIIVSEDLVSYFWGVAEDISDEDLVAHLTSNSLVLSKSVLWVLANAPRESQHRAIRLMSEYTDSISDPSVKEYKDLLCEEMIRESREINTGGSPLFNNGGRPISDGISRSNSNSYEQVNNNNFLELENLEKKNTFLKYFYVVLLIGVGFILLVFKSKINL